MLRGEGSKGRALGIEREGQNASTVPTAQRAQLGARAQVPDHDDGICPRREEQFCALHARREDAFHEIRVPAGEPLRGRPRREVPGVDALIP